MISFTPELRAEEYLKGVWVCSVSNIDFPSKQGLSSAALASELDDIVATCKGSGINALFFQVRPSCDALYKSSLFPWSAVISGTQGIPPDGGFDPLAYLIDKAHSSGIEVHAWINPYRVGKRTGVGTKEIIESLSKDNPAAIHPEWLAECSDGGVYLDPASGDVRKLICDGVAEIVENYPVDGIHFDDYFYPYGVTDFPDEAAFASSGYNDLGDFRRNNVNDLIREVRDVVHSKNPKISFGVSPFGIWDNAKDTPGGSETKGMSSYRDIYADTKAWVEQGIVDYICPQLYWAFENESASYGKLVDWWSGLCKRSKMPLYIGHAAYKLGTGEAGFESSEQLRRQMAYAAESGACGSVFFSYSEIKQNKLGCADVISGRAPDTTDNSDTPAVTSKKIVIASPSNGYSTTASHVSVLGTADPSYPLTVNGQKIKMTVHGYFAVYLSLSGGNNRFVFVNGDNSRTVTYVRKEVSSGSKLPDGVFVNNSAYPSGDCIFSGGQTVSFSVSALPGREVYISVLGEELRMLPSSNDGETVRYSATYTLPNVVTNEIVGEYVFLSDGEKFGGGSFKVTGAPIRLYTQNECYVYDGPDTGSMMDNYQQPAGAAVYAGVYMNGCYKLLSGKWINEENVSETPPEPEPLDIDDGKYLRADLSFDLQPSFQPRVTEDGTLIIGIYGAGKAHIDSKSEGVTGDIVGNSCQTAVFRLSGGAVEGYRIKCDGRTMTVWLYAGRGGGLSGKTVAIDPGHGGSDRGTPGPAGENGICEDDLNLSVSLLLAKKLRDKGASVYLTRTDGSTVPLAERAGMIRSSCPDLSISIHHNATSDNADFNKASGILTLYSRETSAPLAALLESRIANGISLESGSRMQSLRVCRDYRYPCVLLECGYVCNPEEYELLLTREYKEKICDNIVSALTEYFK